MSSESQPTLQLPADYADWLSQLKRDITQSQQRAALSVNAELVQLYGRIGRDILQRQSEQGWGAKVINRLAQDLKDAFPDMRGWSSSNLKYMRFFAQHCPDGQFGQQAADQLPWFHIVTLLTQVDGPADREWYAAQTIQQRWFRLTFELNIKNRLLSRCWCICHARLFLVSENSQSISRCHLKANLRARSTSRLIHNFFTKKCQPANHKNTLS